MVEKKLECYKKAYEEHITMDSPWKEKHSMNTGFIKTCMGWTNMYNIGSAGDSTPEKQQTDREKCDAEHCEWICRVSVYGVHEPMHDWYDQVVKVSEHLLLLNATIGRQGVLIMRNFIVKEIASHDAEVRFLKDTIAEAEKDGKCDHIRRTVDKKEMDLRWELGLRRAQKYVEKVEAEQ
jgi:hypothetical protein